MKNTIILILVIVLVAVGAYFLFRGSSQNEDAKQSQDTLTDTSLSDGNSQADQTPAIETDKSKTIIGKSVEGRDITAYHFGRGDTEILLVGGIHGGYSWNTALVAYEAIDYLKINPEIVPENIKVTIIPVLNPDGLYKVVGTSTAKFAAPDKSVSETIRISGRFNANDVDLNRNFECDWRTDGKWQNKTVGGGSEVFSEPESQAIKNYVEEEKPNAVVVWYSAAGGVFASSCHNGVLPETLKITNIYSRASGYPAYEDFNFYAITGDMTNWLAKKNIPAISVLLTNHTDTEWTKNLEGIKALLQFYSN